MWFRLLCAAVVASIIYWLHKLRMRLLEGRLSRKSELVLNSTADGVVGVEVDGTVSFANPAAMKMLRLTGVPHGMVFHDLIHAECASAEECPMLMPLDRHLPEAIDAFCRADGSSLDMEFSRNAIRDDRQHVTGAVFAFRDITERVAIERMKAEFVSTVSHELRTPLTAIRGSLGLLRTDKLESSRRNRMFDVAISNSDRLLRLVNDILDAERLRSGTVSIALMDCDASPILENACEAMTVLAAKSKVEVRLLPFSARLTADPDRVTQTLTNLIGNAIKFSPSGGTVTVGAQVEESHALFFVRDKGRGIPADKIDSVFERFQQIDDTDRTVKGGTGLGLPICRAIVEQHGGRIYAESELGKGSTFFFTIPLAVAQQESLEFTPHILAV